MQFFLLFFWAKLKQIWYNFDNFHKVIQNGHFKYEIILCQPKWNISNLNESNSILKKVTIYIYYCKIKGCLKDIGLWNTFTKILLENKKWIVIIIILINESIWLFSRVFVVLSSHTHQVIIRRKSHGNGSKMLAWDFESKISWI